MSLPAIHAGGAEAYRRLAAEKRAETRDRFLRLAARLCRARSPFARIRISAAWRRIARRGDKRAALWLARGL